MNRTRRRLLPASLALAGAALIAGLPFAAQAQRPWPSRPITLLVPFAPGGVADITARAVAEHMAGTLGQPVVVDNRPSAGSIVASQTVARAQPDGYTLLLMTNGNAVSEGLFKKLPYDTVKDFAPVTTLGFFDLGIFVPKDSPFRALQDLLRHAKAHPGELRMATIAVGSTQHLAGQMFQTEAGVQMLAVPYKTTPAVVMALRAGEVDAALEIAAPVLPQLKAGEVKLLALTGDQPNPALPAVPIARQAGLPRYQVASWNAIAAPAGTPEPVIAQLNQAARTALAADAVRKRLEPLGVRLEGGSPQQLQSLLNAEIERWGQVIRAAGIEPQ